MNVFVDRCVGPDVITEALSMRGEGTEQISCDLFDRVPSWITNTLK